MLFYINKIALLIVNPITVGVALIVAAMIWRKWSRRLFAVAVLWFVVWSSGMTQYGLCKLLGMDEYCPQALESVPQADAILVLGGGVGWMGGEDMRNAKQGSEGYFTFCGPSDRVVTGAKLWKSGKAPVVITTGCDTKNSDVRFLKELGVPAEAILCEDESRNTEENAKFTVRILTQRNGGTERVEGEVRRKKEEGRSVVGEVSRGERGDGGGRVKVILVTSASHMRRSMMIFRKHAPELEFIPVACDFGSVNYFRKWRFDDFVPSAATLVCNMAVYKECLAVLGYKVIRGY